MQIIQGQYKEFPNSLDVDQYADIGKGVRKTKVGGEYLCKEKEVLVQSLILFMKCDSILCLLPSFKKLNKPWV